MNTEEDNLTAQQSLDIISSMIRQAKGNVQQNSFYFLLWGWTIAVCNLSLYFVLAFTSISNPFWIWLLTIPASIISGIYGSRQEKLHNTTHLDEINKWLWIGYAVVCFTVVLFGYKINYQINPVILCISAVPTFVSGVMLRFRPLIYSGICFWILGTLNFMLPMTEQFLVSGIAIAIGYLVPGYMLKAKKG
jgi:hypothetical protein